MNSATIIPLIDCTETNIEYTFCAIEAVKIRPNWYCVDCGERTFFSFSEIGALLKAYTHTFRTDEGFDDFYQNYQNRKPHWYRPDAAQIYDEVRVARDMIPGLDDLDSVHGGEAR